MRWFRRIENAERDTFVTKSTVFAVELQLDIYSL